MTGCDTCRFDKKSYEESPCADCTFGNSYYSACMTEETAIALLNNLRAFAEDDDEPAIDIAIEALQAKTGGDLISRQDAIGAVGDHFDDDGFKGYFDGQKMMDRIKAIPSADRPTGEWQVRFPYKDTGKTRVCSNCNITQTVNVCDGMVRFKFCPYCGARMRGEEE